LAFIHHFWPCTQNNQNTLLATLWTKDGSSKGVIELKI